jgi:metallophosphoesterase (TIGR00282 family)
VLFIGDVVGKTGRRAVEAHLPRLRERLRADFVVINGENSAGGFGITEVICQGLLDAGADVVTSGNHVWDQREALVFIERQPRFLRPANFPDGVPGRGADIFDARDGRKVLVINAMGRVFMEPLDDPFAAVERELAACRLGRDVDAVVIDFHAEATSEKMSMGHFADGRVSVVVGTHTHVPTADHQIFDGGTAYVSDAGMCGDFNSVLGMKPDEPMARFIRKIPGNRFQPADGEATVCGVLTEIDDDTGLAVRIDLVREGGRLMRYIPDWD